MPPITPQIVLHIDLNDYSGVELGSAASPAYVRIVLCNFGQFLPRISGQTIIGQVTTPGDIPYTGTALSVPLWGNDAITPPGTYYAISILDAAKNVLQTGAYVFTGSGTIDLTAVSPTFPSYSPSVMGSLVTQAFAATETFDCTLVDGPITFDLTLTGDVTSSVALSPFAGQLVTFIISQNNAGNHAFTWPTTVKNAGIINPAANSITTQTFVARANGNLYPIGPQTYS